MSNPQHKEPTKRSDVEEINTGLQTALANLFHKFTEKTLAKKRAGEFKNYQQPAPVYKTPTKNYLKLVLAIASFLCLYVVSWFICVWFLYQLFPMPHSIRQWLAIIPALILAAFLLYLVDNFTAAARRKSK